MVRSTLLVVLKHAILRRLPNGLFDDYGGYIRSLICLSPKKLNKNFTFVKAGFFDKDHSQESEVVKSIKSTLSAKQKLSDGERTLFIEDDEQINSLKRLLELVSAG